MKPENYLNVVEKLNSEMEENAQFFFDEGICFSYQSNYYVDTICFMEFVMFNSEFDEAHTEEHLENIIREKMLEMTNALCKWQRYNIF